MLVITAFGVEEIPTHKSRNLSHGDLTAELIFGTSCNLYGTVHGVLDRPVSKKRGSRKNQQLRKLSEDVTTRYQEGRIPIIAPCVSDAALYQVLFESSLSPSLGRLLLLLLNVLIVLYEGLKLPC